LTTQTLEKRGLDRFFSITKRGSTVGREINGGVATFLAISYIIVLNPIILTGAPAGDIPSFHAIATATALVAAVATIIMALVGRVPFAVAAGLGINGIVAFQLAPVIGFGGAMAVIVLEGAITFILVLTRVREALFNAIPLALKRAIGAGIGAFLVLIGLVDGGIVQGSPLAPSLNLQPLNTWPRLVFVLVLAAVIIMLIRKWRGAIIFAIIGGTVLSIIIESVAKLGSAVDNPTGWVLNVPVVSAQNLFVPPDFSAIGHFSFVDAFGAGPVLLGFFVFSLILADLFDTSGTIVAVGQGAGILDKDGNPPRLRGILAADSLGAVLGGLGGVSSNTTYIESAAGVRAGARTGFASLITGGLLLLAMVFSPLAQLVPSEAAAPILVVVGGSMVWSFVVSTAQELKDRLIADFARLNDEQLTRDGLKGVVARTFIVLEASWEAVASAAVLTILIMPFTYSITNGIGVGFIVYTLSMLAARRRRELHPLMWVMTVAFVIYFALPLIRSWLGV
jgi:AGZA family xanthine/uracil permease-like MFS transporter